MLVAHAYDPSLQEAEAGSFPKFQAVLHGLHVKCQPI